MRVSAQELDAYTRRVSTQQQAARDFVERSLTMFLRLNPGADVAEVRDYGIEVLTQAYRAYGDRAAYLACQWYDEAMGRLGFDVADAVLYNEVEESLVDRDARYLARYLADGDTDRFISRMAAKAYDHVSRAANGTMYGNANRAADRAAGVRYARVPSGRETCGFCLMLASRGFVYRSRERAGDVGGAFNSYHANCDCRVVVGDASTTVDGYDPDWYREVYGRARSEVVGTARDDYEAAGGSSGTGKTYDKYLSDRICAQIETYDRDWVWNGSGS